MSITGSLSETLSVQVQFEITSENIITEAGKLPDGSSREVTVGATGGGAGAGVVEHGDERVGRVANHGLQVKAVL